MSYCSNAPKATVTYKLGTAAERIYVADRTPITVEANNRYTPPFASGQCPINYWIEGKVTYKYDGEPRINVTYLCNIKPPNPFPIAGKILDVYHSCEIGSSCGSDNAVQTFRVVYQSYQTGEILERSVDIKAKEDPTIPSRPTGYGYSLVSWEVTALYPANNQADNCGDPQSACTIKVLHNNQVIFTDKGECPITYSVVCGEKCPPGTTKCLKSGYPGYCCLPCDSIKAEIKAIASHIRSINNG